MTQLTAIGTINQQPVWSPDGQMLVLVTTSGMIGMVSADRPGEVWQVKTEPVQPNLTAIALVP